MIFIRCYYLVSSQSTSPLNEHFKMQRLFLDGMLRHSCGGAVIFVSLQHFITQNLCSAIPCNVPIACYYLSGLLVSVKQNLLLLLL